MKQLAIALALAGGAAVANAQQTAVVFSMNLVSDAGASGPLGQVVATESKFGVVLKPDLSGLPPGLHGFHLHENGSCEAKEKDGKKVPGLGAGGHYDPQKAGQHGAPWDEGHRGDLPPLFVGADGKAVQPVLAPRLKLAELKGRALVVHAGGDNHADRPEPLGGGGARIACGVGS